MFLDIKRRAIQARRFLLDCFFPLSCAGCGQEGDWLCLPCAQSLEYLAVEPVCWQCGKEVRPGYSCPACAKATNIDGLLAPFSYHNQVVSNLLKIYKYQFCHELGLELANLLSGWLVKGVKDNKLSNITFDLVVPVPLHASRLRWRGYNQSEILAKAVTEVFQVPLEVDLLKRNRRTRPQAKLANELRLANVSGCFTVKKDLGLDNKLIILVDDVATTMATLTSAAKTLKQAGAGQIWAITLLKA
ncbi:MAG: double zinc ribbon domain-containing protein [Candidatus Falkowbacteria bacterium]